MRLPPSPALSACDSLDGIEDLDAYLAQQGNLSHFPTPPLNPKQEPPVEVAEIEDDFSEDGQDGPDYDHVALVLTEEASLDVAPMPDDINKVLSILIAADLPLVVVALAFNILSELHLREAYTGRYTDCSPDLLVVTALSLAVTCTYDHPPTTLFWSRRICQGSWTKDSIERSIMKILASLDFRLHEFSLPHRLEKALAKLSEDTNAVPQSHEYHNEYTTPVKEPLKLVIDSPPTFWNSGQITPEQTPPCEATFSAEAFRPMQFLRLL